MTTTNPNPLEEQLLRRAPDAMLIVDEQGHIINANPLLEKLFDYGREELIGMHVEDLIPERLRGRHRKYLREYFKNPRTRPMGTGLEIASLRRDDSEFETEISLSPVQTPNGTVVLAAVRDISELKYAQRTLEQATSKLKKTIEQRDAELLQITAQLRQQIAERIQAETDLKTMDQSYRHLVDNQPDMICRFLPDTTLTFVNVAYSNFFGCKPDEIMGKRFIEFLAEADRETVLAHLAACTPQNPSQQYEHKTRRVDGSYRWHLWNDRGFFDGNGNILGYQSVGVDISDHKRAERALRTSEARYRRLLEASPLGMLTYRLEDETRLIFTGGNSTADRILGIDSTQFIGLSIQEAFPPLADTKLPEAYCKVARDGTRWRTDEIHYDHDGIKGVFEVSAFQPADREVAVIFSDISKRKLANAALAESIRQKTAILNNIPDIAWLKDRDSRFIAVNEPFGEACGFSPKELVKKTDLDIWPQELAQSYRADDVEVMRTGKRKRVEERLVGSDGRESWIETIKTPIVNEQGEIIGTTGIARDITERKRAEEALYAEKERAQITLHSIVDGVITTDAQGCVEYMNPIAESLTGWNVEQARGKSLGTVFRVVHEYTRQPIPDVAAHCIKEGKIAGLSHPAVLISRDGDEHEIEDSAAPLCARDGNLLGVVLVFHDVTEARRLAKQMAHDATHDALTGLVNRREFEKRLEKALKSATEHSAQHALCYLDLDQFKVVNDTAGHAAGDELLKQIRNVLASTFRERDTFARLGGDEFGLLLDNCPLDNAVSIAHAMIAKIRDHKFVWENRSFRIGVSIGLVPITIDSESVATLLSQADVACYSAKELGRNQFHVYSQQDSEPAQRHIEILRASTLRDALEQERFCLYCQPIMPLSPRSNKPARHEVLIRLRDENGELVLPEEFIPAAERYGMMGEIDRWILHSALHAHTTEFDDTHQKISINLSGNSLSDASLLDYVHQLFAECSISPDSVCFEITETAVIHNLKAATTFIKDILELGGHIALDDFGNGLSSFRYLKTLPVDYLKIDGNFVKDMHKNASDYALVAAINQVGHTMGIQTIAEYAHNEAIVVHLEKLGVDYAQGYALGIPEQCPGLAPSTA